MNMWSWRPAWDPLSELQRHMDSLIDFTAVVSRQFWQSWRPYPPYNYYETPTEFVLVAPLPGLRPEDLDISVTDRTLTLKGERKRPGNDPDENYRRQERWFGKWSRVIPIPEKAESSQVTAALDNGLLMIRMPKVLENQSRQVTVTVSPTK
jgi:HSP20 family protein